MLKNFMTMLLIVAITAGVNTNTANAQTNNPQGEFVIKAQETAVLIGLLLPAVQKVREAAARNFASVLKEAQSLAAKVEKAGPNMSPTQYRTFQRQLQSLGLKLDRIYAQSSSATDGPAGCMTECDDAYPGWGGGNGWNRFWCKSACLKIKIGVKGGSVGGD